MTESKRSIKPPNYTQTPNEILDYWMRLLSPAEFKVLMCICRKTFGWGKQNDTISYSQMEEFTGLSDKGVRLACDSLVEQGLIRKIRLNTPEGDAAPNTYEIVVDCIPTPSPGGELSTPPVGNSLPHGVGNSVPTQKKPYTKETPTTTPPTPSKGASLAVAACEDDYVGLVKSKLVGWNDDELAKAVELVSRMSWEEIESKKNLVGFVVWAVRNGEWEQWKNRPLRPKKGSEAYAEERASKSEKVELPNREVANLAESLYGDQIRSCIVRGVRINGFADVEIGEDALIFHHQAGQDEVLFDLPSSKFMETLVRLLDKRGCDPETLQKAISGCHQDLIRLDRIA